MKAEEFKEWLKEEPTRIEKVLEGLECHGIWNNKTEYRCCSPDGDNNTAVSVNMETLFCKHYGNGETFRGDIISLAEYFREDSFKESFRFLLSLFGLSTNYKKQKAKTDPLSVFKQIRKKSSKTVAIEEREVPKFGYEVLDDFVIMPHINLFYEGITPQTAELFKCGYDGIQDRIIFPHFAYDDINAIVGITGRTLRTKEEMEMFNVPKYWNYIKNYRKTWNLFGFSHSIEYIEEQNMIIIFEAEKSVMKHFSQTRNKGFSVSTGGHEISYEQVQIILQNTSEDVEVVVAFDKDIMMMKDKEGNQIGEDFLKQQCSKFSKYRKASYIYDKFNILGEKSSPIDEGVKKFNHLLKYRIEVK